MIDLKYNEESVRAKRKLIADKLKSESETIKSDRIEVISNYDLRLLYEFYDEIFFDKWFLNNFKGLFRFSLSRRMTKSAGITKCPKNVKQIPDCQIVIEICIGVDFFFKYDYLEGNKNTCGIESQNSLEALQIIFEHELLHALEFLLYHKSDCKKGIFKETAKNMFGHTQSHHQLPTNHEIIAKKYDIKIGDKVRFMFDNTRLTGIVNNINRRATVLVLNPDGKLVDKYGNKYKKYLVPAQYLQKVGKA